MKPCFILLLILLTMVSCHNNQTSDERHPIEQALQPVSFPRCAKVMEDARLSLAEAGPYRAVESVSSLRPTELPLYCERQTALYDQSLTETPSVYFITLQSMEKPFIERVDWSRDGYLYLKVSFYGCDSRIPMYVDDPFGLKGISLSRVLAADDIKGIIIVRKERYPVALSVHKYHLETKEAVSCEFVAALSSSIHYDEYDNLPLLNLHDASPFGYR